MRSLICALVCLFCTNSFLNAKTDILWDTYGVPHIFAPNREAMFYAHGWAQMRNQANLLLLLYGQSRGRAAEYWGPEYLSLDGWLQINGVPERAQQWYAAQNPTFRRYLDEFARGINDFGRTHPELIEAKYRIVLPVSGVDVIGHALRVVQYMYMGSQKELKREIDLFGQALESRLAGDDMSERQPGSNTWAIGRAKSASGNTMLLINPHLDWGNTFYRYMEVHMTAPDYDLYGAPQIGFPVPVVGFNRKAGWGRTVNTLDTVDFYRLVVKGGKYEFDGAMRDFEQHTKTLKVRMPNGSMQEARLLVREAQ